MGNGQGEGDRREVWSGPLFNEDPNQPSGSCPETPQVHQTRKTRLPVEEGKQEGLGPRKREKFLLMQRRSLGGGAGKSTKRERKVQEETERRGLIGGWPAEITAWVTGQVTAAIDPLIGCLTVSTRPPNPLIRGVSCCVCLVSVCQNGYYLCHVQSVSVPLELISVQLPQEADKNTVQLHQ